MIFFARVKTREMKNSHVFLGQTLGFTIICAVSLIGIAFGAFLPPGYIGFLGFLPLLIGFYRFLNLVRYKLLPYVKKTLGRGGAAQQQTNEPDVEATHRDGGNTGDQPNDDHQRSQEADENRTAFSLDLHSLADQSEASPKHTGWPRSSDPSFARTDTSTTFTATNSAERFIIDFLIEGDDHHPTDTVPASGNSLALVDPAASSAAQDVNINTTINENRVHENRVQDNSTIPSQREPETPPASLNDADNNCVRKRVRTCLSLSVFEVALLTVANGGDNLSVYLPLFANSSAEVIITTLVIFYCLLAVWLFIAYLLLQCPTVATTLATYGEYVVPFALMGIGMYVLWGTVLFSSVREG